MNHDESDKPQEAVPASVPEPPKPESGAAPQPVQQPVPSAPQQEAPQPVVVQQAPTIQYVKAPEEHVGVAGWLVGWIVYLALWAVGGVTSFFATLAAQSSDVGSYAYSTDEGNAIKMLTLLFMPFIVIAALGAILMIAQRKRLGKTFSLAFIGIAGLYVVLSAVMTAGEVVAVVAGYITAVLIICPLQALYFFQSERVKKTLTK